MLRTLLDRALIRRPRNILHFPQVKLAYFVIPKAGNTSVRNFLLPLQQSGEGEGVHKNISKEIPWEYVSPASLARKRGYFTFAITRNPYARLISTFQNKISPNWIHPPLAALGFDKDMLFAEFVERVGQIPDRDIDFHLKSQAYLLEYRGGLQPERVFDISELGAAEAAVKGWVASKGGELGGSIGHSNISKKKPEIEALLQGQGLINGDLERIREIVQRRYRRDFELLGYEPLF